MEPANTHLISGEFCSRREILFTDKMSDARGPRGESRGGRRAVIREEIGAGEEIRTLDPNLGKVRHLGLRRFVAV